MHNNITSNNVLGSDQKTWSMQFNQINKVTIKQLTYRNKVEAHRK